MLPLPNFCKQKLIALELCARTFKVEENVNKIYSNCCCLPLLRMILLLLLLFFTTFFSFFLSFFLAFLLFLTCNRVICCALHCRLHKIQMHNLHCITIEWNNVSFCIRVANMLASISVTEWWNDLQRSPTNTVVGKQHEMRREKKILKTNNKKIQYKCIYYENRCTYSL